MPIMLKVKIIDTLKKMISDFEMSRISVIAVGREEKEP